VRLSLQLVALGMLRAYKRLLSPMLPAACRYVPTCSDFASEAIERHGALRGGWLALGRLLRCHPLAGAGYDPVPLDSRVFSRCRPLTSRALHTGER
jgi:putative membrane protein insertion efficiency factor